MKKSDILIISVVPGGIAEEVGIEAGRFIISINGNIINDIFDYRYQVVNENIVIELRKKNGEEWEVEVDKDEYEDLGIEFLNSMIDQEKSCLNKCIFCFVDQLPKGMRKTLYYKDDDTRLSFLTGNYVTLTNMSQKEIDRIVKYKMSPINVSVHTTRPSLRNFMLGNKNSGDVWDKIKSLTQGGILVNCQIVLCRGINDCEELDKTIKELSNLGSCVDSISVVPVGTTRYRDGLFSLLVFDPQYAISVVEQVESWQKRLFEKAGSRTVYLADEIYIMANKKIPSYEEYEDFPQIENGVGLIAALRHDFYKYLSEDYYFDNKTRIISIVTGLLAYDFIVELAKILENKHKKLKINVYRIKNYFFGENVTVTGLLTGVDIFNQLKEKELGEELLISKCTLKAGSDVFLDDYTVSQLSKDLGIRVNIVENNGRDLLKSMLGILQ